MNHVQAWWRSSRMPSSYPVSSRAVTGIGAPWERRSEKARSHASHISCDEHGGGRGNAVEGRFREPRGVEHVLTPGIAQRPVRKEGDVLASRAHSARLPMPPSRARSASCKGDLLAHGGIGVENELPACHATQRPVGRAGKRRKPPLPRGKQRQTRSKSED